MAKKISPKVDLGKLTKAELIAMVSSKVKSVITAQKEIVESARGNEIVLFSDENDKGYFNIQVKYAPFEDKLGGIVSIAQWRTSKKRGRHFNYVAFSTTKLFGGNEKMLASMNSCDWSEYKPK